MQRRSAKVQFLFWAAFFAILFFLWIAFVVFNTLVLTTPLTDAHIKLLFVLYIFVGFFSLAGLVLATLINNRFYERLFGIVIFLLFLSLIAFRTFTD